MSEISKNLFLITAPIGNSEDITLRALNTLRNCNVLLCEEPRLVRGWLKSWGIDFYQGIFNIQSDVLYVSTFDENTDSKELAYLKQEVLPHVSSVAFMSGSGCPMFHDPGNKIVKFFRGFRINYIPGVSSLGSLMMHLPQPRNDSGFRVYGFLPRDKFARNECWKDLIMSKQPVFLMETAYRLKVFCDELLKYASNMQIIFGYALTKSSEQVFKGQVQKLIPRISSLQKDDFVVFLLPKEERSIPIKKNDESKRWHKRK